jgi:hypothetical protein
MRIAALISCLLLVIAGTYYVLVENNWAGLFPMCVGGLALPIIAKKENHG